MILDPNKKNSVLFSVYFREKHTIHLVESTNIIDIFFLYIIHLITICQLI